jgi:hypothetical protein
VSNSLRNFAIEPQKADGRIVTFGGYSFDRPNDCITMEGKSDGLSYFVAGFIPKSESKTATIPVLCRSPPPVHFDDCHNDQWLPC